MADRSDSSARPSARGCGLLSRESLEHVAQARIDHTLRPDELALAHVLLCEECRAAVDRLVVRRRLVTELARLERSEPVARSQDDDHEQIPGYRIINELHRGGQGTVFLAEQTSTRRKCAVKMLIGGRFASPRPSPTRIAAA